MNVGTWFTTGMVFANSFFTVDVAFKIIISGLSFVLLILQIGNQWAIRKKRKEDETER
jgi:hypothetical protein